MTAFEQKQLTDRATREAAAGITASEYLPLPVGGTWYVSSAKPTESGKHIAMVLKQDHGDKRVYGRILIPAEMADDAYPAGTRIIEPVLEPVEVPVEIGTDTEWLAALPVHTVNTDTGMVYTSHLVRLTGAASVALPAAFDQAAVLRSLRPAPKA